MPTNPIPFQPFRDRYLVRAIEEVEGAIKTPEESKPRPQLGEIVAVGDGRMLEDGRRIPLNFACGDHVYFGKYAGSALVLDGEDFTIMLEEEILGKIPGARGLHASSHIDG